MHLSIRALVVAGAAAASTPLQAAPLTFFGEDTGLGEATPLAASPNATAARAAFLSSLIGVGTENFEGFAAGTGAPLALSFPGSSGGITATLNGAISISSVVPGTTNGFGRYATSGTNFVETTSDSFTITFSTAVAAFGFFGIDIGDFNGQVTVATQNGAPQLFNVGNALNGPGGSVLFWGIIDADHPFTSITFGNTAAGADVFGFDDMTIGDLQQVREVAEPASAALLGAGLGLIFLRRRRR